MNLGLIRVLSEKRDGGLKKIASDIGMSEANLHRCINNNRIQASDLENIALLLRANIEDFFDVELKCKGHHAIANGDRSVAAINSDVTAGTDAAVLQERVKALEMILEEKERLIRVLMDRK